MSTRRSNHKKLDHWTLVQKVILGGITAYTLYRLVKKQHSIRHTLPVAVPHAGGTQFPRTRKA